MPAPGDSDAAEQPSPVAATARGTRRYRLISPFQPGAAALSPSTASSPARGGHRITEPRRGLTSCPRSPLMTRHTAPRAAGSGTSRQTRRAKRGPAAAATPFSSRSAALSTAFTMRFGRDTLAHCTTSTAASSLCTMVLRRWPESSVMRCGMSPTRATGADRPRQPMGARERLGWNALVSRAAAWKAPMLASIPSLSSSAADPGTAGMMESFTMRSAYVTPWCCCTAHRGSQAPWRAPSASPGGQRAPAHARL